MEVVVPSGLPCQRLTGQWHHLHQVSSRVMSCEQAGHCPAAFGGPEARSPRRRGERFGASRLAGARRTGAPGTRRWQCGQCSGPASKLLRHRPQVIAGMSVGILARAGRARGAIWRGSYRVAARRRRSRGGTVAVHW